MEYYLAPVAAALHTTPAGPNAATARQWLADYGPNQLADAKHQAWWQLLLNQFADVMILVLLAAAGISLAVGEAQSAYVILAIIILNAGLGFGQEYRADKALAALQQLAPPQAQVLQGRQPQAVPAASLVPGDAVLLEAGNVISADVRLLETHALHALQVDESSLTGEPANVEKNSDPLPAGPYPLADRLNLGHKGTSVTAGRATAYVVATGMQTELGKIVRLLQTDDTQTPLQQRLGTFSKWLAAGEVAICAVFFAAGWWRGEPLGNLLLVSISLAVAAILEALPLHAHRAGDGRAAAGQRPRPGAQAARRGNAGLGHLHLHRQNGHAGPQPDDYPGGIRQPGVRADCAGPQHRRQRGPRWRVARRFDRGGAGPLRRRACLPPPPARSPVSAPGRAAFQCRAQVHDHPAPGRARRAGAH